MNILNLTGIESDDAVAPDVYVGTPEEPIYLHPVASPALTGSRANQSTRDRVAYLKKQGKLDDEDVLLPYDGRLHRRTVARSEATRRRKATRRHVERDRAANIQANHLAQMFNLDKGLVPASDWWIRQRATNSVNRAVKTIVDADRERFDKEFRRYVIDGKRGKPPRQPLRHEEARARLEGVALGARTRVPKERRYDRGGPLTPGLTIAENRTGVAEVVTTGRTGRAS